MRRITTTITKGGQITLPAEVRRILGVNPRDTVAFAIDDGTVRIVALKESLESIAGSVKPATSTEDLDRRIREANEEMAEKSVALLRQE